MAFSKPKRDSWALEINVFQTFRDKSRRQSTSCFNILILQLHSMRAWKTSARTSTLSCCIKITSLPLCELHRLPKPSSGEDCHTVLNALSIGHSAIFQHCRKQCRRSLSHVGSTATTSFLKKTILRMHSVCSSFNDLWMKSSRDNIRAVEKFAVHISLGDSHNFEITPEVKHTIV